MPSFNLPPAVETVDDDTPFSDEESLGSGTVGSNLSVASFSRDISSAPTRAYFSKEKCCMVKHYLKAAGTDVVLVCGAPKDACQRGHGKLREAGDLAEDGYYTTRSTARYIDGIHHSRMSTVDYHAERKAERSASDAAVKALLGSPSYQSKVAAVDNDISPSASSPSYELVDQKPEARKPTPGMAKGLGVGTVLDFGPQLVSLKPKTESEGKVETESEGSGGSNPVLKVGAHHHHPVPNFGSFGGTLQAKGVSDEPGEAISRGVRWKAPYEEITFEHDVPGLSKAKEGLDKTKGKVSGPKYQEASEHLGKVRQLELLVAQMEMQMKALGKPKEDDPGPPPAQRRGVVARAVRTYASETGPPSPRTTSHSVTPAASAGQPFGNRGEVEDQWWVVTSELKNLAKILHDCEEAARVLSECSEDGEGRMFPTFDAGLRYIKAWRFNRESAAPREEVAAVEAAPVREAVRQLDRPVDHQVEDDYFPPRGAAAGTDSSKDKNELFGMKIASEASLKTGITPRGVSRGAGDDLTNAMVDAVFLPGTSSGVGESDNGADIIGAAVQELVGDRRGDVRGSRVKRDFQWDRASRTALRMIKTEEDLRTRLSDLLDVKDRAVEQMELTITSILLNEGWMEDRAEAWAHRGYITRIIRDSVQYYMSLHYYLLELVSNDLPWSYVTEEIKHHVDKLSMCRSLQPSRLQALCAIYCYLHLRVE